MQGIKPARVWSTPSAIKSAGKACLTLPDYFFVLEREMPLRIRHGATIKPNIDQVRNPFHGFAGWTYQDDIIHIRFMQIQNAFMQVMLVYISHPIPAFAFCISAFSSSMEPMQFLLLRLRYSRQAREYPRSGCGSGSSPPYSPASYQSVLRRLTSVSS